MGMARAGFLLLLLFFLVFQSLLVSGLKVEQVGERGRTTEGLSEEGFEGEIGETRHASVGGGHKAGGAPGAMSHHTNSPPGASNACSTIMHFVLARFSFALLASLLLRYI